jgi:catechol 2,3-dioxygenase-like lactoylglutathione lyase family enzyme
MLSKSKVYATIPASDIDRAARWYEEKLGFKPQEKTPGGYVYEAGGGSAFTLYPTANAGKSPATLLGFDVSDLDAEMRDLRKRGVKFEDYDLPNLKTEGGVAIMGPARVAWFRDSEGNILSIVQTG